MANVVGNNLSIIGDAKKVKEIEDFIMQKFFEPRLFYNCKLVKNINGDANIVSFKTRWKPPISFMHMLSYMYNDIHFYHEWYGEGYDGTNKVYQMHLFNKEEIIFSKRPEDMTKRELEYVRP